MRSIRRQIVGSGPKLDEVARFSVTQASDSDKLLRGSKHCINSKMIAYQMTVFCNINQTGNSLTLDISAMADVIDGLLANRFDVAPSRERHPCQQYC